MRHRKTEKKPAAKITKQEAEEALASVSSTPVNIDLMPKVLEALVAIHSTLLKIQGAMEHPKPMVMSQAGETMIVKEHPFANGKGKIIDVEPAPKTAKEEVKEEIGATVPLNVVREAASKFAAKFGQAAVLDLITQHGDVRKLSEVPEEKLDALYKAFQEKLVTDDTDVEDEIDQKANVGLDDLKKVAGDFMKKAGPEALKGLLKTFGASKLSEVRVEKYNALFEAMSNA